jgi:hypothetical protein
VIGAEFTQRFGIADFVYEIYFERRAGRTAQNKFHSRVTAPETALKSTGAQIDPPKS